MTKPEPDFEDDLEETQEAITEALNALDDVKAYTLKLDELKDFKAAQYALRNLCEDHYTENDVPELYTSKVCVEGNEREFME